MTKSKTKDVIAGLGELGEPIFQLISKETATLGYDKNPKLNKKSSKKYFSMKTNLLHICIPFTRKFIQNVLALNKKFQPKGIVIHSTISPGTTKKLQSKMSIPIIYSATRGVHKRMLYDLKRYTKFFTIESDAPKAKWATKTFSNLMKKCKVKTKKMSNPKTLELAKIIVDTSYYGWLINYAQISNIIAKKHGVDYDEMWSFADEIHKYLGNRPKMYPGLIGGHCVVENLDLINNETLNMIDEINNLYASKVKDVKPIAKNTKKTKII